MTTPKNVFTGKMEKAEIIKKLQELSAQKQNIEENIEDLTAELEQIELTQIESTENALLHEPKSISTAVDKFSSAADKIALFLSLFAVRNDVFAKRWYSNKTDKGGYSPACENEWSGGLCDKKRFKCIDCPNRKFSKLTPAVIERHLRGKAVIGGYPLFPDDTCRMLALDFDGDS
jgi:hypothetical protein